MSLQDSANGRVCRRKTLRLPGYDYASRGAYFVTICTHLHKQILGKVTGTVVELSTFGNIVRQEWLSSSKLRDEIRLDIFVVMPNHVHGIVWIVSNNNVGATGRSHLPGPRPKSLGAFIGGYKSAVTKRVNQIRNTAGAPFWQRNYYEHVIRNDASLDRIREYISTNPLRWDLDRENPRRRGDDEFDQWLASFKRPPDRKK